MSREAFEAWLNPGHHAGNVSPWVEPGRYQKETHQLAWLAWKAAQADAFERAEVADVRRGLVAAERGHHDPVSIDPSPLLAVGGNQEDAVDQPVRRAGERGQLVVKIRNTGWVPLAPHDVYVPSFRYGPRYYQQVNRVAAHVEHTQSHGIQPSGCNPAALPRLVGTRDRRRRAAAERRPATGRTCRICDPTGMSPTTPHAGHAGRQEPAAILDYR